MELFIILLFTAMILLLSVLCIIDIIKGNGFETNFFIYTLFVYSFLVFILSLSCVYKPSAIDVYRGKTTLEITYKDKVPVDSTVVWKNNKYNK